MSEHVVTLHVNGEARTVTADIRSTLLDLLRERLHLTAPRRAATTGCAARAPSRSTASASSAA